MFLDTVMLYLHNMLRRAVILIWYPFIIEISCSTCCCNVYPQLCTLCVVGVVLEQDSLPRSIVTASYQSASSKQSRVGSLIKWMLFSTRRLTLVWKRLIDKHVRKSLPCSSSSGHGARRLCEDICNHQFSLKRVHDGTHELAVRNLLHGSTLRWSKL